MFLRVLRAQAFIGVDVVGVGGGKGLSAWCQERNWEKICLQICKVCHLRYTYVFCFLTVLSTSATYFFPFSNFSKIR